MRLKCRTVLSVLCVWHFSFSRLQTKIRIRAFWLWCCCGWCCLLLRLMISSRYFCARKYVYGTDTQIAMLWIHDLYTTSHNGRVNSSHWNKCIHIYFVTVSPVLWSELNKMEHTETLELKNLFWRCCYCCFCCWLFFFASAAIKWNVFIIFVSANTHVAVGFSFTSLLRTTAK